MPAAEELYRLDTASSGLGLFCEETGVSLAGVPLLKKSSSGYAPRAAHEIDALIKGAYGHDVDAIRLTSGLRVAAEALNRGDVGRAMIAVVQLRLPELSRHAAERLTRADEVLAKYDPNEPRDRRGRWTTGGETGDAAAVTPPRRRVGAPDGVSPSNPPVEAGRRNAEPPRPEQSWNGPTHLYGGQLISVGGPGSNGPPEDPVEIPEPTPDFNPTQVPQGFDTPGHVSGGLEYKPFRHPTLPNGQPWPVATPDLVLNLLRLQPGSRPMIYVYVPRDGIGPMLSGETEFQDLEKPEGYDEVQFIGRPQFTPLGAGESRHAIESVIEGLRLAETNEFSAVIFNSTLTTIARYVQPPYVIAVESLRRPDVAAITRPSIDREDRVVPFEILSDGQTLREREAELPTVPGIRTIDGRHYEKRLERFSAAWFRRLGVRRLCL